jgi:hypothetical protein
VRWDAVNGATGYEVYYSAGTDPASATLFAGDTNTSDTQALITGLSGGAAVYHVWVKSTNPSGSSGFSPRGIGPVRAPDTPGAVTVTPGDKQLTVRWDAASGAAEYEVYYSAGTDPAGAILFTGDTNVYNTEAVVTGLANNTAYHVWVKAKNPLGESVLSSMAGGTPLPTTVKIIAIAFWSNNDGAILSSGGGLAITLSRSGTAHPAELVVTVDESYAAAEWLFNGERHPETGLTFTVNAAGIEYTSGVIHRLGVTVRKDGIPYSTDIRITVVD